MLWYSIIIIHNVIKANDSEYFIILATLKGLSVGVGKGLACSIWRGQAKHSPKVRYYFNENISGRLQLLHYNIII